MSSNPRVMAVRSLMETADVRHTRARVRPRVMGRVVPDIAMTTVPVAPGRAGPSDSAGRGLAAGGHSSISASNHGAAILAATGGRSCDSYGWHRHRRGSRSCARNLDVGAAGELASLRPVCSCVVRHVARHRRRRRADTDAARGRATLDEHRA